MKYQQIAGILGCDNLQIAENKNKDRFKEQYCMTDLFPSVFFTIDQFEMP